MSAPRRPELSPEAVKKHTALALIKMKKRGRVWREVREWLALRGQPKEIRNDDQ